MAGAPTVSFEAWYQARNKQTMVRSNMAWARLGYNAHDDEIADLEEEIFQWKLASGLVDGNGDPDGIKPQHLQEMLTSQGCTIEKQTCPDHGYVHGQEAEELRKGLEKLMGEVPYCEMTEESVTCSDLQQLLNDTDARDSLAFIEAKKA